MAGVPEVKEGNQVDVVPESVDAVEDTSMAPSDRDSITEESSCTMSVTTTPESQISASDSEADKTVVQEKDTEKETESENEGLPFQTPRRSKRKAKGSKR